MRPIQVHTRLIHTHNSVGGVLYKATDCEDPGIQGLGGWGAGGSSWAEQGLPTAGTHQDDHKGYKVYCLWSSLFCISHLTCCSLFDAQKRLILQLEELKHQWEIKLSSGNIFSSLLNNVELLNWVELVNVTRVNVKYLFSMWHWTMSCDKFPVSGQWVWRWHQRHWFKAAQGAAAHRLEAIIVKLLIRISSRCDCAPSCTHHLFSLL